MVHASLGDKIDRAVLYQGTQHCKNSQEPKSHFTTQRNLQSSYKPKTSISQRGIVDRMGQREARCKTRLNRKHTTTLQHQRHLSMPATSVLKPGFSVPHVWLTTETNHYGPSAARQTWISKHRASGTRSAAVPSPLTHLDPTRTSSLKHTKIHRNTGRNSLSSLHLWVHLLLILPSPPPSSFPCPSILLELNPIAYPPPLGFDRSPL